MGEFGVGCQVQVFDRARQFEQRRRGEKEIIGQREHGADRAGVGGLLIGVVVRRLLWLRSVEVRPLRGEGGSDRKIGIAQAGLHRWRGLGGDPVEMPERQRKLDRERKQRQPRAVLEVFPEPVHDVRLPRTAKRLGRPDVIL
jgi:hypothetical protein